ncbi:MAG TPA: HEAT repeat domain-containing protein [Armatimonadota bacterium]|nr:HEAT repeat domain-containing protein [Armatimonadota bacterium]
MDLNLIDRHCAWCGAPVESGQDSCPVCHRSISDPAVTALLDRVISEGAAAIRSTGESCGSIGCSTLLLHYLSSPDRNLATAAADALASTRDPASLKELVRLLGTGRWLGHATGVGTTVEEDGATSLLAVVRAAFKHDDELHKSVLMEMVRSAAPAEREAAVDLLRYQSGQDVVDALRQALKSDPESAVRARAAFALGQMRESGSIDDLILAVDDDSEVVQGKAAQALSRMGQTVLPAAIHSLNDGSPHAKLHAARLLGHLETPEAIAALIEALKNRQGLTRLFAEQALAQIGTRVIIPLLHALIAQGDQFGIREGVAYVLRTMKLSAYERMLVQPVIDAADRYNPGPETVAAAYKVLGVLERMTPDDLRAGLESI